MNIDKFSYSWRVECVTNVTSAACLIEAEKDRFRRLESESQPAASQA